MLNLVARVPNLVARSGRLVAKLVSEDMSFKTGIEPSGWDLSLKA